MSVLRFMDFEIDKDAMRLSQNGCEIALEPQVFALLTFLAENGDRVVSKDEIVATVWNGRAVSDSAIASRINAVRRAVGDDGRSQAIIKTIPMKGFRFVADMRAGKGKTVKTENRTPIAILPFRNLSSDPEQKYFVDGMLEDLVAKLSKIRWFLVISNATTGTYTSDPTDIPSMGNALGVRYLVTGSIRRSGDTVRVSAQLWDASQGASIWAESYDRDMADIFRVQDEITVCVAAAIENEVGVVEQAEAVRASPENLAAWSCYQRAMSRLRNDAALFGREEVADLFDSAIEQDPFFALAYAGRAFWEYWVHIEGQRQADFQLGFNYAQKAVELDPREPFGHHTLGAMHFIAGNQESSMAAFQRAIELNPSFAWSYHLLAMTKVNLDQLEEADDLIDTAIRISPRDTLIGIFLAGKSIIELCRKNFDDTIIWGRKAMMYPQPRWVHAYVLSALGHQGRTDEAEEVLTIISRLRPEFTIEYFENTFKILSGEPKALLLTGLKLGGLPEH